MYPNPLSVNANEINFTLPSNVNQLNIDIYNITGSLLKSYQDIDLATGVNNISKPALAQGMYLLRFTFNKGAQTITKRLIVK